MDHEQRLGIMSIEASERSFARWWQFVLFPGFGWAGLIAPLFLDGFGWVVAALTFYASLAYTWPGLFQSFWAELGVRAPDKLEEFVIDVRQLGANLADAWKDGWSKMVTAVETSTEQRREASRAKKATKRDAAIDEAQSARTMGLGSFQPTGMLMPVATLAETPAAESPAPVATAPATPKKKIDLGWLVALFADWRFYAALALFVGVMTLATCSVRPFWEPSGKEVAAQAQVNEAQRRETRARAEVRQAERSTVRVEHHAQALDQIETDTQATREAIRNAEDIETRYARLREFDQRMRDGFAASRSRAVQDYRSSLDP